MTRKDYILIAGLLAEAYRNALHIDSINGNKVLSTGAFSTAETIARGLAADNARFDQAHFLAVVRGEKDLNSHPSKGGR